MDIIDRLQNRLRWQRIATAGSISVSAAVSIGLLLYGVMHLTIATSAIISGIVLLLLTGIYYRSGSFSLPPSNIIIRFLDRTCPEVEESAALLKKPDLTTLEKLQAERIEKNLASSNGSIRLPRRRLFRSLTLSVALIVVASIVSFWPLQSTDMNQVTESRTDVSGRIDDGSDLTEAPSIESISISVTPPSYTGLSRSVESGGSVAAVVMSGLDWSVDISGDVEVASLVFNNREEVSLRPNGSGQFRAAITAGNRLIYRVMASSKDTTVYSSYFSIDVTDDTPPQFRVREPAQFRTLLTENKRQVEMSVDISDDFGVTDAWLNATLARGSGESVRFREQRMMFDNIEGLGSKNVAASLLLDADSLGLTPGDELYLHAVATDNHPDIQSGRSETYMIVIEDTTRSQPLLAGNIQIDLMPEDFRSQRQIIVDTEELIEEQKTISDEQFRIRSRRIGRDQEMLMLDFGHYLGMEEESVLPSGNVEAGVDDHGHSHGHDHTDESGTVIEPELDGEGQETTRSTSASIIPDEFFHDHGSPEMNTLFAESPRALLTRALNEMFQASRYLLLDQPDEALAFEYRALEFLQQAQQADRRYVRRAGLDGIPIPVNEDRLTGEIDDFANPRNSVRSDRATPPLVLLEQQLREDDAAGDDWGEDAAQIINEAAITEADKLYLLNRINRLSSTTETTEIREQLLTRLTAINSSRQRYPSPVKVPAFQTTGPNR